MARMILEALSAEGEEPLTLSERILDEKLGRYRSVRRPRVTQTLFVTDNTAVDAQSAGIADVQRPDEPADVAWLYAWSYAGLHS